ncbi:MAG: ornithine carbamoyltransferase [Nitrospirae bacterium]|nr:ornithine carbamoyltransferase [Nitrospirota bacterium]
MPRHLLTLEDVPPRVLGRLLTRAAHFKRRRGGHGQPLRGKTVALIFQKASTRTRVSFEIAASELGGTPIFLSGNETHLSRGESPEDMARVLNRYVHALVLRTFAQETLERMAAVATVPVINALSDALHPCQILADLLTIQEKFGRWRDLDIVYVGDGNNVANTWVQAAAIYGLRLTVSCPKGFEPDARLVTKAGANGHPVRIERNPHVAVRGAHVLYTDVWVSMGQEAEQARRLRVLRPYQLDERVVAQARPDAIVLHCLPAHRGEEIDAAVMDGPRSAVFDQAENRLHIQKAILEWLTEDIS